MMVKRANPGIGAHSVREVAADWDTIGRLRARRDDERRAARSLRTGGVDEYGDDVTSVDGALGWLRAVDRRPRSTKIESIPHYVGAVRRLLEREVQRRDGAWHGLPMEGVDRLPGGGFATRHIDGRLVAVGWCHETPSAWAGGRLHAFAGYHVRATPFGRLVGSTYCADPELVYQAWRAGVPAWIVRALGAMMPRCGCQPLPRARMERLRRAARAAARTSVHRHSGMIVGITFGALAALGRVSPELQRVVLDRSGYDSLAEQPLRPGQLRWDLAAPVMRQMAADRTGRVRASWATGRRQYALVLAASVAGWSDVIAAEYTPGVFDQRALVEWLTPQHPNLPEPWAWRMVRGDSPVSLSGGHLSAREAHRWLLTVGPHDGDPVVSATAWLARGLPQDAPPLRDPEVVRWALDVARRGAWPALTRDRTVHGPGGVVATVRYLERLDEIQPADLDRGPATGVDRAFEAAATRVGTAWIDAARTDHRVLRAAPRWPLYPRSMRVLVTPAQLAAEGDAMEHCVAGYVQPVAAGQSVILALSAAGHRSTVELTADGRRVLQHRGARNGPPHPVLERLLSRFLARLRAF